MEQQSTVTVIIGAGPAGLAVGACLKKEGHPFILLEKSDKIGASWHNHYDRLHLHTDKKRSELPYFSYPEEFPKYPSRQQVIYYLQSYAHYFNLRPKFNQEVISAGFEKGRWYARTKTCLYESDNLVIASGYNSCPHIPKWQGIDQFNGQVIHSSEYQNGEPFQSQNVLVVGFGNSGGEIAIDLYEHGAEVAIAVRNPVNIIPRELFGLPILALAIPLSKLPPRLADALTAPILRMIFGNLKKSGPQKLDCGPFEQIQKYGRIPMIDVGTVKLIRDGKICVYPAIERFISQKVIFTDASQKHIDAVILATGYRPNVSKFLKHGSWHHQEEAASQGLFFCGFNVVATGVLREIAIEARRIAGQIRGRKLTADQYF